jgi:hypothetical protein
LKCSANRVKARNLRIYQVVPNPSEVVLLDMTQRSNRSTRRYAKWLPTGVPETPTTAIWEVLESLGWYLDNLIFQTTTNESGGGKMDKHAVCETLVKSFAVTERTVCYCENLDNWNNLMMSMWYWMQ